MIYIHLFKNFSVSEIVYDFAVLKEHPGIIHDGKLLELNCGECFDVCRGETIPEDDGILFRQYRISNLDDEPTEELLEEFLMPIL